MAIQYSGGTYVSSTFVGDTKANIILGLQSALTTAGWTIVSGSGTTNLLMRSATTAQGLSIANNFKDNTGTCVQCSLQSGDGVKVAGNSLTNGGNLQPAAARTFRVIASKYQWFCFVPGSFNAAARLFCASGVPYIPAPNAVPAYAGWLICDSIADNQTYIVNCWRKQLSLVQNKSGSVQLLWNTAIWEVANDPQNTPNVLSSLQFYTVTSPLLALNGGNTTSGFPAPYRWQSNDIVSQDPLLSWGDTVNTDEGKIKAQLWDAIIINDSLTGDTTTTFDTHTWWNLTDANTGSAGNAIRGSLLVATG